MEASHGNMIELFTGYQTIFQGAFESAENQAAYQMLATTVKSNTSIEEYNWLGQFPRMRKWLGERQWKRLKSHKFSISNDEYEDGIEVSRKHIEDDAHGIYAPLAKGLGIAAAEWPNDMVFDAFVAGETLLGYDEKALFASDHPVGASAVSNLTGGGGTPWYVVDDSRPLKPIILQMRLKPEMQTITDPQSEHVIKMNSFLFGLRARAGAGAGLWQTAHKSAATLNTANLNSVIESMMGIENDEGRKIGIKPKKLIVPISLRSTARPIIKAMTLANGASNTDYEILDLVVSEKL